MNVTITPFINLSTTVEKFMLHYILCESTVNKCLSLVVVLPQI